MASNLPSSLAGAVVEQNVRLGLGGAAARLVLSNRYGRVPVRIASVRLGRHAMPVRFPGAGPAGEAVLPAGGDLLSDPVPGPFAPGEDVAISLGLVGEPRVESFHWDARSTARVRTPDGRTAETTVRLFASQLLVERPDAPPALVVLGDSITDGSGVPLDSEQRWTDLLARRAGDVAVVNAGISGARLLADGMGENAVDRFDHDVAGQPGVRAVMLQIGLNDIGQPGTLLAPESPPMTSDRFVSGYRRLAAKARTLGIRVVATTISPFQDALPDSPMANTFSTPEKEELRRRVNQWIRSEFDPVFDLDRVLRDPGRPARLLRRFDCGDHADPGPAGNAAIADAVDLEVAMGAG